MSLQGRYNLIGPTKMEGLSSDMSRIIIPIGEIIHNIHIHNYTK